MVSELRHGAARSKKVYEELGEAAQNPEIKEALDARELVSSQIMNRLDECFKLIGEKRGHVIKCWLDTEHPAASWYQLELPRPKTPCSKCWAKMGLTYHDPADCPQIHVQNSPR
jgi:hypothetical protein